MSCLWSLRISRFLSRSLSSLLRRSKIRRWMRIGIEPSKVLSLLSWRYKSLKRKLFSKPSNFSIYQVDKTQGNPNILFTLLLLSQRHSRLGNLSKLMISWRFWSPRWISVQFLAYLEFLTGMTSKGSPTVLCLMFKERFIRWLRVACMRLGFYMLTLKRENRSFITSEFNYIF